MRVRSLDKPNHRLLLYECRDRFQIFRETVGVEHTVIVHLQAKLRRVRRSLIHSSGAHWKERVLLLRKSFRFQGVGIHVGIERTATACCHSEL